MVALMTELSQWTERFAGVPTVAVEFVASKSDGQLEWYRKLQSTAWAMIEEAFSEQVITPGVTTTEVSWLLFPSPSPLTFPQLVSLHSTTDMNTGCRMVPTLQSPAAELQYMVPPRRRDCHLAPRSIPLIPLPPKSQAQPSRTQDQN
jgi:hypothetical protein